MSGGVVIRKSPPVVVAPSETVKEATTTGDMLCLSGDDMLMGDFAVTVLLVFEHAIQDPVVTIKRGLSRALVHYYPLAGRLAPGAAAIKCTGEGVPFVAASTDCTIKEVQALSDPWLQQDLALFYPAPAAATTTKDDGIISRYSDDDPLVLMQGTVFSCGGFALGVTWKHAVADGIGIGQFLQAVGELARGLPSPTVIPVRQKQQDITPPFYLDLLQLMDSIQPSQMSTLDITVKPSLVKCIKDKYASLHSGRRHCTVFEAVAAVLWRCRTRAIGAGPEALSALTFSADARKSLGAAEHHGFYGNCLTTRLATASSGSVGNGDLMDLVRTVQRAKDGAAPDLRTSELDLYNLLMMSCWRNIGLEAPDFGGGRPARVKCNWPETATQPICIACLPCKDDEEYSVLSVCVREEHTAAFLQELAHMHLHYI